VKSPYAYPRERWTAPSASSDLALGVKRIVSLSMPTKMDRSSKKKRIQGRHTAQCWRQAVSATSKMSNPAGLCYPPGSRAPNRGTFVYLSVRPFNATAATGRARAKIIWHYGSRNRKRPQGKAHYATANRWIRLWLVVDSNQERPLVALGGTGLALVDYAHTRAIRCRALELGTHH